LAGATKTGAKWEAFVSFERQYASYSKIIEGSKRGEMLDNARRYIDGVLGA
jgi:hypothetical protein